MWQCSGFWGKDAVVASEVDPGFWHQGSQSRHEIHRIERYLNCTIPVGCLESVDHLAGGTEGQAWDGDRRAGNVPAEPFPFVSLVALAAHAGMEGESIGPGHPFQSRVRAIQWPNGTADMLFATDA